MTTREEYVELRNEDVRKANDNWNYISTHLDIPKPKSLKDLNIVLRRIVEEIVKLKK